MLTLGKSGAVTSSVNDTITHSLFFLQMGHSNSFEYDPQLGSSDRLDEHGPLL